MGDEKKENSIEILKSIKPGIADVFKRIKDVSGFTFIYLSQIKIIYNLLIFIFSIASAYKIQNAYVESMENMGLFYQHKTISEKIQIAKEINNRENFDKIIEYLFEEYKIEDENWEYSRMKFVVTLCRFREIMLEYSSSKFTISIVDINSKIKTTTDSLCDINDEKEPRTKQLLSVYKLSMYSEDINEDTLEVRFNEKEVIADYKDLKERFISEYYTENKRDKGQQKTHSKLDELRNSVEGLRGDDYLKGLLSTAKFDSEAVFKYFLNEDITTIEQKIREDTSVFLYINTNVFSKNKEDSSGKRYRNLLMEEFDNVVIHGAFPQDIQGGKISKEEIGDKLFVNMAIISEYNLTKSDLLKRIENILPEERNKGIDIVYPITIGEQESIVPLDEEDSDKFINNVKPFLQNLNFQYTDTEEYISRNLPNKLTMTQLLAVFPLSFYNPRLDGEKEDALIDNHLQMAQKWGIKEYTDWLSVKSEDIAEYLSEEANEALDKEELEKDIEEILEQIDKTHRHITGKTDNS